MNPQASDLLPSAFIETVMARIKNSKWARKGGIDLAQVRRDLEATEYRYGEWKCKFVDTIGKNTFWVFVFAGGRMEFCLDTSQDRYRESLVLVSSF